jgi:hypothetical protein
MASVSASLMADSWASRAASSSASAGGPQRGDDGRRQQWPKRIRTQCGGLSHHRRVWIHGLQSKQIEQVVSGFRTQNLASGDGFGAFGAALIPPVQKHWQDHGAQLQQRFSRNGCHWPGGVKRRTSSHDLEASRCIGRAAALARNRASPHQAGFAIPPPMASPATVRCSQPRAHSPGCDLIVTRAQ